MKKKIKKSEDFYSGLDTGTLTDDTSSVTVTTSGSNTLLNGNNTLGVFNSNTGGITWANTWSNSVYGNYTITQTKYKYHILGEDVELETYSSPELISIIATLNILGEPYYRQLKLNNMSFGKELEDFIEKRLKVLKRDETIDKLIKEG